MKDFWDERYGADEYAYGTEPNTFFKASLEKLKLSGKILLPAEGEGRNAVFAAQQGLDVYAFDLSEAGQKKALKLADEKGVDIHYAVGEFSHHDFAPESFDTIGLIFAHFPAEKREVYHRKLADYLKKGGIIILEAYSKEQIKYNSVNPKSGGPRNEAMLFSTGEIEKWFDHFEILLLEQRIVTFQEGLYHQGEGSVVRFIGRKK
ncbi:MAG: class I SAM-dependent methyltransferase [Bacteroidetes bacterium]|nr:class I SAM-dependent methyltransferase [Bacteroidota bacterium]